jgi:hypothetical protein
MDTVLIWTVAKYVLPHTLLQYQTRSRDLISALRRAHPKFTNMTCLGSNGTMQVPDDLTQLGAVLAQQVFDREHLRDYVDLNPDGTLAPHSLSKIGFSTSYFTSSDESNSILPPDKGGIELAIRGVAASEDQAASVVLKLPTDCRSDIHDPSIARTLLEILIDHWDCTFGGVSLQRYQRKIRGSQRDTYAGQWLFYLPHTSLGKCLPTSILSESFAEGTLISTTLHLPDADSPADLIAGNKIKEVLDDLGLISNSTFAIAGWPPDQEEARYEQFISGAPPGRKYTVHCVNFDGYDPDRKVLLYAKLFRRLRRHPKEWGLRGWDGPVLNEAKRQVRAAAKAGGVPIEWHIGLEEPAHAVRQLLADHTSITEQQLRVIYTPLEEAHQP